MLQDDGDFIVRAALGAVLWRTTAVQDFHTPTIEIVDADGYAHVETSETWKILCSQLPCFGALHSPGYATLVFDDELDGQAVVIHVEGLDPDAPGRQVPPGGRRSRGREYRRMPGSLRLRSLPLLPGPLEEFIVGAVGTFTDRESGGCSRSSTSRSNSRWSTR